MRFSYFRDEATYKLVEAATAWTLALWKTRLYMHIRYTELKWNKGKHTVFGMSFY